MNVEQLDQQILEVLADDIPQSIRHVFCRMANPRFPESVEKTENGYQQVQNASIQPACSLREHLDPAVDFTFHRIVLRRIVPNLEDALADANAVLQ